MNKIEQWKQAKHGFDVRPDLLEHAQRRTPMKQIDQTDLERMKWHGVFYRKRDAPGTYMLRIRLTGCELSAPQAKEIAYLAYEFGHGFVDITTRANIQLQGLSIEHVPQALDRLERVGLTTKQTGHDNIRNVFGHPLSGVDPDELIDTRSLCADVTSLFIESRVYSDLPRKFNIAISGRASHAAHYWTQDISFLACREPDGEVMFQVLIGGTQGQNPHLGWHLPVLVAPSQVVEVTRSLLDLFRERGSREKRDRARFRFLVEQIGIGSVLDHLEEDLDFLLRPSVAEPAPPIGYDELIGWFPQSQAKLWAMGLCIPLGRMTWRQLEGLAVLSKKWGDGHLRTTHEQGLIAINLPSGFRDAAATDSAALGLGVQADSLSRNTVACTGKQFCNIAVTETKGQMLQLVDQLRRRGVMLHGIRIHMSGCPSSCAQHFTADIGLKGVRVRRLLGTREGFDVYLGGGIAGRIHFATAYKLGVDAGQLPQLIEAVVREYYTKHRAGQTFSAYWRERLGSNHPDKVGDRDFTPPVWLCEGCGYRHTGEDPPVFCPSCAGLRRLFARLEDESISAESALPPEDQPPARSDGFLLAAQLDDVPPDAGLAVEVAGRELALWRVDGNVVALDNACPHEGGPLAEGTFDSGAVVCPWHGWTFNACSGCSLEPPDHRVARYETKLEDGRVFVQVATTEKATSDQTATSPAPVVTRPKAKHAVLEVVDILQETPSTKTFRFDNRDRRIPPHKPGQFARLCVRRDGREIWRSFTVSSPPTRPDYLDLTVKRNPAGEVSNFLHDGVSVGDKLAIKAPQGGFYFDAEQHREPLVLISAGSGITPMMSMLRYLADTKSTLRCTMIHGARSPQEIIFHEECRSLAKTMDTLTYFVTLTRPSADWQGAVGRLDLSMVTERIAEVAAGRYFLCGPGGFMNQWQDALTSAGVPSERIHTEAFQSTASPVPMI